MNMSKVPSQLGKAEMIAKNPIFRDIHLPNKAPGFLGFGKGLDVI